ncbi:MAG: hypothetical protein H7Z43_14395 [Clostridia bacterium]|nr:hypothetical protein [Deltaproteobacteria bacterium]
MALLKYFVALAATVVAACSLAYDWDADGQPCRTLGAGASASYVCNSGFSCFRKDGVATTSCVRDNSRRRGDECTEDAMCDNGLSCAGGACRESCGASYYSPSQCRGDEFCKPYTGQAEGFCTQSECSNEQCPSGRICAEIKGNVGACLVECTPTFLDKSYSDNCGSTTGQQYCQQVGRGDTRRLVCLDTDNRGQTIGTPCNSIDNPCAAGLSYTDSDGQTYDYGLSCINSSCREFCDPNAASLSTNTTDCGAGTARGYTYCCPQVGAPDRDGSVTTWGICTNLTGSTCASDGNNL